MFVNARRKKKKKRFFFLLILIIAVPIVIVFALGEGKTGADLNLAELSSGAKPILATGNTNSPWAELYVPMHEDDFWQIHNNTLELWLHNPDVLNIIPTNMEQLDQHTTLRWEAKSSVVVEFHLDNLPPVVNVAKMPIGYRIKWSETGLAGKRIVLDPGHGGHDPGAIGYQLGLMEKDVTLAIAMELKSLLELAEVEVFLTRSTDSLVEPSVQPGQHIRPDLWKRRDMAEDWCPDVFVSIHNNSFTDRSVAGIETYYNQDSFNAAQSKRMAQSVHDRLVSELGRRDRNVRYKKSSDAVLQVDNFPAILTEILYISNATEEKILAQRGFARQAAEAIVLGLEDFFSGHGGENR